MHKIWDMHYPLEQDCDLASEIGRVLIMLGFPKEAIAYFKSSVQTLGYKNETVQNLLFCYTYLKEYENGISLLQKLAQDVSSLKSNSNLNN